MVKAVVLRSRAGAGQVVRTLVVASLACLASVSVGYGQTPGTEQPTASVITGLTVLQHSGGATVVEITADAPFASDSVRHFHLPGELPRGVLRIRGIASRYRPYTTEVGDANVYRIRAGHHPEHDPPELHVVFDLVSASVRISEVARDGNRLRVHLSGSARRSPIESATPAPAATPTRLPTAAPLVTPTPRSTSTPTATPTPRPVSTPTATPTPRPTLTATPAATATRPVSPTSWPEPEGVASAEAAAAPTQAPSPKSSNYRVWGDSRPPVREQGYRVRRDPANGVTEIVTSDRGDGSSVLRISANGDFTSGSFRHLETAADPLRDILLIRGVEISTSPLILDVEDPNLEQLELTMDRESRPPYLRVELRFTGPLVQVERATSQGRHLVVLLSQR